METSQPLAECVRGPLENAAFHVHLGAGVLHGPIAAAHGVFSTWFDLLPPPKMDGRSVQTFRVVIRQRTHEPKEKTLSSSRPIFRSTSKTALKRSLLLQDAGGSLSWDDEQLCKPE